MNATTGKVALGPRHGAAVGLVPERAGDPRPGRLWRRQLLRGLAHTGDQQHDADFRKSGGCTDTNDNLADFLIAGPAPRNSASPLNTCSGVLTVVIDSPGMGTVAVVPNQPSYPNGTPVQLTASANIPGGFHFVSWGGDATGSSNPLNLVMNGDRTVIAHFAANTPVGRIVISQISGGGGNGAAPYLNDYVELYNRGSLPVDITGWSLQYASSTGSSWSTTNLIGTIPPGHYYLIQQQAGVGTGAALPAPDAIGVINLSAVTGKVALVNSGVVLAGTARPVRTSSTSSATARRIAPRALRRRWRRTTSRRSSATVTAVTTRIGTSWTSPWVPRLRATARRRNTSAPSGWPWRTASRTSRSAMPCRIRCAACSHPVRAATRVGREDRGHRRPGPHRRDARERTAAGRPARSEVGWLGQRRCPAAGDLPGQDAGCGDDARPPRQP
jgi:hypothetical protein